MKKIIFALLLMIPTVVLATEGEHAAHGLDAQVIKTIIYQLINVGIIVIALAIYLKEPVRKYFAEKRAAYLQAEEKAQAARKLAEQEHMRIQIQLTKLESTVEDSMARARADAADLRNQLVADAQALSKRMRQDAEQAAHMEVERAKRELRHEMIAQATQMAESQIRGHVSQEDHQRLQGEFIQHIQAVHT